MPNETTKIVRYWLIFLFLCVFSVLFFTTQQHNLSGCRVYDAIDKQHKLLQDDMQYESRATANATQQSNHLQQQQQQQEFQTKKQRLEFVHIPKTGGTVIESIASDANITWSICHFGIAKYMVKISNNLTHCLPDALKHFWPREPKFGECPWWHVPPSHIETFFPDYNPYSGADLFTVVRNPYERIVSEYYYVIQDVQQNKKSNSNNNNNNINAEKFNAEIHQKLSKYASKMRRGDLSRNIPGNNVYFKSSGHLIPQHDFVYEDNHRKLIKHVLRFENLKEDFDNLMALYGLPLRLPEQKYRFSAGKELGVHNLTEENVLLIENIYWDDFRKFGYEVLSLKAKN